MTITSERHAVDRELLVVRGLKVEFQAGAGTVRAVRGLDLEVGSGEFVGLVGESGSGKSVTGRAIMGILDPRRSKVTAERVVMGGSALVGPGGPSKRRRPGREGMAMVFQNPFTSLNPVFRVGTLLKEVLHRHRGLKGTQASKVAEELLDAVRVPDARRRLRVYPHELSGGMQQRVSLALALAVQPQLVIADEPTTALDVTTQAQILNLLVDLQRERSMSVLFISHDLTLVSEVAARVYVMYAGRVAEAGPQNVMSGAAAHPYTVGLIRSVPSLAYTGGRLPTIEGTPPRPGHLPSGCKFHPRCPRRTDICIQEEPELFNVRESQRAACYHPLLPEEDLT